MPLALQPKKFINSEHVGDFANIILPGIEDKSGNARPEEARIHYIEAGTGEPLILVHTVGQSLYTWRDCFHALSEHYRVIAVDLLGHGYSSRPISFDYTIAEHTVALKLFLDALQIESAHFCGFSMGAMYVLDFIIKHPKCTGKTILVSPGGITESMPLSIRMLDSGFLGSIACALYSRRTVEKCLHDCFFDLTFITEEVLDGYYITLSDKYSRKAMHLSAVNFDELDVLQNMRTVETDVLVLWGADDKWHPPEGSEVFHLAMQTASFGVIRNAGHVLHEEKGQRFVSSVLEYIPAPVDGD